MTMKLSISGAFMLICAAISASFYVTLRLGSSWRAPSDWSCDASAWLTLFYYCYMDMLLETIMTSLASSILWSCHSDCTNSPNEILPSLLKSKLPISAKTTLKCDT